MPTVFARTATLVALVLAVALVSWGCGGDGSPSTPTTPSQTTRVIGLTGTLAFGNVAVGQSSTLPLTITNSGNATLTISRLITSMSAPSTFSTTVQGANTIAAGGSLQVTVTFKPGAVGSYSGMLQVDGDHTSGTDKMDMSGSGVAAVALPVR